MVNSDSDVSISQENKQILENLQLELRTTEKMLKRAIKQAENCYIIDRGNILMQNEIIGVSMKEAFDNELKRSMNQKSQLQIDMEKVLEQLSNSRSKLLDIR